MRITEEEKKNILSKYNENTSEDFLRHLKRSYPTFEQSVEFSDKPIKFINIGDKPRMIKGNKKNLVNIIFARVEENWQYLGDEMIRRTIKKFLDGIGI